jgi:hypothetical protein
MKSLLTASFFGTFFLYTAALAVELPGWERPLESASMRIVQAQGQLAEAKLARLTLTRQDGQVSPTGFTLEMDGRTYALRVAEMRGAGCGSVSYRAVAGASEGIDDAVHVESRLIELTVIDHAGRFCADFAPSRWEARLELQDVLEGSAVGSLELEGHPEPVFTIQQ